MAIRSATASSRPKLCVAITIAPPEDLNEARCSSSHFFARWSRPANGSSSSRTRGRARTNRARDSRRFIPAENVRTRSPANRSSSTLASAPASAAAEVRSPASVVQNVRFSNAVRSS